MSFLKLFIALCLAAEVLTFVQQVRILGLNLFKALLSEFTQSNFLINVSCIVKPCGLESHALLHEHVSFCDCLAKLFIGLVHFSSYELKEFSPVTFFLLEVAVIIIIQEDL